MTEYPDKRRYGLPRRRNEICDLLARAYTDNQIELEDYEHRLELANRAECLEDLERVIHDFPDFRDATAPAVPAEMTPVARPPDPTETRVAIIGDQRLDHHDFLNGNVRTVSLIGDVKVHLEKMPRLAEPVVLTVFNLIGDTTLFIPQGMGVKNEVINILGDTEVLRHDESDVNGSGGLCIIRGFSLIGDITVKEEGYRKKKFFRSRRNK
jgi:hypothetical protein